MNRLETGNGSEARLNAATELGNLGEPAASAIIEKMEAENPSLGEK